MPATSPVGRRRRYKVSPIKNYNIVKHQKVYFAQINVKQGFKARNGKLDHKVNFAKHYEPSIRHWEPAIKAKKHTNHYYSHCLTDCAHEHMIKRMNMSHCTFKQFHDMKQSINIVKVLHRKWNSKIHNISKTARKTSMWTMCPSGLFFL